jgi:hypothetical protein
VQPNWPDEFLLHMHRSRLVDVLVGDQALRQEVRDRLRMPVSTALGAELARSGSRDCTPVDVGQVLAAAIAAADDPVAVPESVNLNGAPLGGFY